jgi:hypothetical protein
MPCEASVDTSPVRHTFLKFAAPNSWRLWTYHAQVWMPGDAANSACGSQKVGINSLESLLKTNDEAGRFRLMCGQLCKVRITPISKAYYLTVLSFHPGNFEHLQHVKSPGVEKESMMPKQFAEMRDGRMILGKHLCWKLRQDLVYLGFA